jgi:hypothetical protein
MTKSLWQQYKEKYSTTPLDFLKPSTEYAETELSKQRMDICRSCEFLISLTKQCKKCGCFMPAKTIIEKSKCPIGKW